MTTAEATELTRRDLAERVHEAAMQNGGDPRKAAANVARGIAGSETLKDWWSAVGPWAALTAYREMRRRSSNGHHEANGKSDVPENWGSSRFDGVNPLDLPKAIGNTGDFKAVGAWTREDVEAQVHFLGELRQTIGYKLDQWRSVHALMEDEQTISEVMDDLPPELREFVLNEAG